VITVNDSDVTGDREAVRAYNAGGGAVTVITRAGDLLGAFGRGIYARNLLGTGAVTITTNALVTGNNGAGIEAIQDGSGGTTITITGTSTVRGSLAAVLASGTGGGTISIANAGTLRNLDGLDASLVVSATGGPVELENANLMTGRIVFGALADALTNSGTWNTGGSSDFGTGSDSLENTGGIVAANLAGTSEDTIFAGLESFVNEGEIILSDEAARGGATAFDSLRIAGDFDGVSGVLRLDAFLGGAGSAADRLVITGSATGQTTVVINNTSPGSGGIDANILVVDTNGATGTEFTLFGGPLRIGAYIYDLVFEDNDFFLRSALDSLRLDAATLPAILGDVWEVTTAGWHRNTFQLHAASGGGADVTPSSMGGAPGGNRTLGWGTLILDHRESDGTIIADVGGGETPVGVGFDQTTRAVIGGVDVMLPRDANGGTLTFGALLGVVDSTVTFDLTGNRAELDGPTFGVHVAYTTDLLRANLIVKRDDLDLEYEVAGLGEEPGRADAVSTGVSLEFGYKVHEAAGLTVEAVGNLSHVVTRVDDFSVGASTFSFDDAETTRGAIGLTFRGNVEAGALNVIPSATVKYWNVFDAGHSSAIDAVAFSYDHSGNFVEASAMLEFDDPESGWSGFVSGSGFVGNDRGGARGQIGVNLEW